MHPAFYHFRLHNNRFKLSYLCLYQEVNQLLFRMKLNKIYLLFALLIIITTVSWITSCAHEAKIGDMPQICFDTDVLPVFKINCAISGCHDGSGGERRAYNNFTDISRSVVPFNPDASRAYQAIIATWGENKMPPDQPLTLANRTIIRLWIEQGAGEVICDTTAGNGGTGNSSYVNPRTCFTRDILPVLSSRCASAKCHDAISHESGYNFTTFANTLKAVSAGNPSGSKLYKVIKLTSGEEKMPPLGSPQLSKAEIDSIGKWISYGALNENCGEVCDTINPVTFPATIWPIIQTSCTGCHSGTTPSGNVLLASYNNVAVVASSGLLMNSLNGNGVTKMPPSVTFSACRIKQFQTWVSNGFLNN